MVIPVIDLTTLEIDVATARLYLAEAVAARHRLAMGSAAETLRVKVGEQERMVTYRSHDLASLNAYILALRAIIDPPARRGPIHLTF